MTWVRARSDEQKAERIAEIVEATARLFERQSFEEITFASIAKEASFTRSNLYKYFNTKEEIFLEFLRQDMIRWRDALIKAYKPNKSYSTKEFASVWVKVFSRRRRLMRLMSILYVHLEKNISEKIFVEFKRQSSEGISAISKVLCGIFPLLTEKKAADFILLQMASAIGLYQMTSYNELQREVLGRAEFKHMKMDFATAFTESVEHLISGMSG